MLRGFNISQWSSLRSRFLSAILTSIIIVEHLSLWYNIRRTFLLLGWKIFSSLFRGFLLSMGFVKVIGLPFWRIFILMNCQHPYRRSFSTWCWLSRCCTCPFASLSCGRAFMALSFRLSKWLACNFCSLDDYEASQICFSILSKTALYTTHNMHVDLSCNTQYQTDTFTNMRKTPFNFQTQFIYAMAFIKKSYW